MRFGAGQWGNAEDGIATGISEEADDVRHWLFGGPGNDGTQAPTE
jgi:hypothetical protein